MSERTDVTAAERTDSTTPGRTGFTAGLATLAVALVALAAFAGTASAHDVGGRLDAPIPLSFLFVGAGATVAGTAAWLGASERPPDASRRRLGTLSPSLAAVLRGVARVAFVVLVCAAFLHGVVGRQVRAENLATVFVWPLWLKGVGLLAALVGSPWPVISPWRAAYDWLARLEGRPLALLGSYPDRLGAWPALVGFLALVGVLENLTTVPADPAATALVVVCYATAMLVGGVCFGREWFRNADPLSVLYRLFARVALIRATRFDETNDCDDDEGGDGYEVSLRPPWHGCVAPVESLALVGFVVAAVYTVSFDGFTNTSEYQTLLFEARDLFGFGSLTGLSLYVVGLAGFLVAFALTAATVRWLAAGSPAGWTTTALAFAPTVVPIAVAYELAHNYRFVARYVGVALTLGAETALGEPVSRIALLGWLSLPAFWASQVVLVVVGHLVAVVAAHHVALDRYGTRRAALRGHLPLVALMVGYTVLSLWIISRPVVT